MKRALTAVVLIPLVLLALFRAPLWLFAVIVGLVAMGAIGEYLDIAAAYGTTPFRKATYAFLLLFFLSISVSLWVREKVAEISADQMQHLTMLQSPESQARDAETQSPEHAYVRVVFAAACLRSAAFLAPFVLLVLGLRRADLREALLGSALSSFGLAYVAIPLFLLILLRAGPSGSFYVLLLLLIVWAGDIAAYYVGSAFGKRPLAARISPKKTWEGAVASVVASLAVGVPLMRHGDKVMGPLEKAGLLRSSMELPFMSPYPPPASMWVCFALIVIANVAAQLGDLAESGMKRGAGVKDSGTILPGHGGVLDRIDALLFAVPVVWYYANFPADFSKLVVWY